MMREAIQQGGGHFGIAKDTGNPVLIGLDAEALGLIHLPR